MSEQQLLWHYTTGDVFKRILKQGAILADRTEPENEKEIPTVTFSSHPTWEPTRYRVGKLPNGQIIMLNKPLLQQFCNGLIRIGVKPELAPMNWHAMKDRVGVSQRAKKAIYDFAISVGGRTSHWFATFDNVPEDAWMSVQILKEDQWVDLPEDEIPNVDDVNLDEKHNMVVDMFPQVVDNVPQVDVPLESEVTDDSGMETASMDGQTV